jgi:chromosome segregation ATPase
MNTCTSLDMDNVRRIEQLRAMFERLRTERIRAESEVERLQRELEQAREAARAAFGTDSEDEIRNMIETARAQNTRVVDEFEALLHSIEARLREPGGDP